MIEKERKKQLKKDIKLKQEKLKKEREEKRANVIKNNPEVVGKNLGLLALAKIYRGTKDKKFAKESVKAEYSSPGYLGGKTKKTKFDSPLGTIDTSGKKKKKPFDTYTRD